VISCFFLLVEINFAKVVLFTEINKRFNPHCSSPPKKQEKNTKKRAILSKNHPILQPLKLQIIDNQKSDFSKTRL
jgi:hypothetical protein